MATLYPIFYGTRMVTFDVLKATFEPHMHPEAARRGFNFVLSREGRFGIGGGFRTTQPSKPGFAPAGKSFHQAQPFPTGRFYCAWDMVCANPGGIHRTPRWGEVPAQGSKFAEDYGWHMNVGSEPWHAQPIELDGWETWERRGNPDILYNRPIVDAGGTQPPPPPTEGITVQFQSRNLEQGHTGSDVKFFQRIMNDIAGQGLELDGNYGPTTVWAVTTWQKFFGLTVDGKMGAQTQRSMIELSLLKS